jgi:hypothetical protein
MSELEARQHADGDGADSTLQSDDEVCQDFSRVRTSRKRRHGPREEGGSDESDEDDDRRAQLASMMGTAAFGGAAHYARGGGSDVESMPSQNSSTRRRDAFRDAFPVRGVSCVGCALANRIGPVNRFVREGISTMTEDALWKMAALVYKREVSEPAEREGAPTPPWPWKDVRVHYELHISSNYVARHKMIRQLQSMRHAHEARLVRVEGGEKELDRQNADLMLKVCIPSPLAARHAALTACVCALRSARPSRASGLCWSRSRRRRSATDARRMRD